MLGQTGHLDQCIVYVLCSCGAVVPIKDTEEAKGVILPQLAMPASPGSDCTPGFWKIFHLAAFNAQC